LEEIRAMLSQRTPLYRECADLEVDTDEKTLAEVAAEILREFHLLGDV
jgi:shikimate kinase